MGGLVRLEPLSGEKNEHIVYMETRTRNMAWFRGPDVPEVYLCPPMEFKDRRLKLTFVGNLNEIKKLLVRAQKVGQKFKILSLAYTSGYYDVPRRIESEELARKFNIVKSTLVEHLRKAEKRLITDIMGKEEEAFPLSLLRR